MNATVEEPPESVMNAAAKAELQEALDDLALGIRRPEKIRAACERMGRIREANRVKFGVRNIAVQLIRETRDQA